MCFSSTSRTFTSTDKNTQRCILPYVLYILLCSMVSSKFWVHSQYVSLRRLTTLSIFIHFIILFINIIPSFLIFTSAKACHEHE